MKDGKALVVGGLAVLAVAAASAYWLLAGGTEAPASAAADRQGSRAASVEGGPDVARSSIPLDHDEPIPMNVYMSPLCGCCGVWVEHVEEHGFEVEVHHRTDQGEVKRAFGVPMALASCHTAVVNGYIIEGHVPGEDVRRFLAEAPAARGLAVPGMPVGSPGMEAPDGRVDPYEVLLFTSDGRMEVFARHGPGGPRR